MPFHPRALIAPLAAVAVVVGPAAASLPAAAGAAVRTAYLPKQAVAVGTGGAVASDDVGAGASPTSTAASWAAAS